MDPTAAPRFRLLVGGSEGGLATALALERDAPVLVEPRLWEKEAMRQLVQR